MEFIPAFHLSKKYLEHLSDEDLPRVRKMAEKTKQGFQELVEMLDPKKYPKTRVYIENLSHSIGTFFDWWLETGNWIPLNTNAIESGFSRVKNRVWSVGKRWSENGLLNWLGSWGQAFACSFLSIIYLLYLRNLMQPPPQYPLYPISG